MMTKLKTRVRSVLASPVTQCVVGIAGFVVALIALFK